MYTSSHNLAVIVIIMLSLASCRQGSKDQVRFNEPEAKKEVWDVVATRLNTWKENNFEAHMAVYHADWRRWSLNSRQLMKREDFSDLWEGMKNNEQVMDIKLEPIEIMFYDEGKVAIAHYISTESYLWTGEEMTGDDGKVIGRGSVQTVTMRWSDVMIKEHGKWLYVGGHRDFGKLVEAGKDEPES